MLTFMLSAVETLGLETVSATIDRLIAFLPNLIASGLIVVLGAFGITLGVTLALGARPVVSHILTGHFLRQSFAVGERVEVGGRTGEVERVGAIDTVINDGTRRWSVPNSKLLEEEEVVR